jgi:hypothetical protein
MHEDETTTWRGPILRVSPSMDDLEAGIDAEETA